MLKKKTTLVYFSYVSFRFELLIPQKNHTKVTDTSHTKSWKKGCPSRCLQLAHDISALSNFLCMKTLLKAFMNKLEEQWLRHGFSEKGTEEIKNSSFH